MSIKKIILYSGLVTTLAVGVKLYNENKEVIDLAVASIDIEEYSKRIDEVLKLVGLPHKRKSMPHQLSGGEQQRIVIARAILNKPALILADEPTGNLDVETGRSIVELLKNICNSGSAIIMITHNLNLLTEYPGTVYKFENHQIKDISTQISSF